MEKKELLELVNIAFKDNVYPGDGNISIGESKESIDLKNAFKGKKWEDLNHDFLFKFKDFIPFFSIEGFQYYLPAFLTYLVNDFYGADSLVDGLMNRLTLPQEIDIINLAYNIKKFRIDKELSEVDFEKYLISHAENTDKRVQKFMSQVKLFSKLESKTIKNFLIYIGERYKEDFEFDLITPQMAIDRYWFIFKEI